MAVASAGIVSTHMNLRPIRSYLVLSTAILAAAAAQSLRAQQAPAPQPPDFSKVEIKTTRLAEDFYTLEGQGGTISVLTGPDGVLLVDSQFAPLTDKLVAAIRKISDKPIRYLIDTHVHGDHTGGNENFAKLGVTRTPRRTARPGNPRQRRPCPRSPMTDP